MDPGSKTKDPFPIAFACSAGIGILYFLITRLSLFFVVRPEGIAVLWPVSGFIISVLLLSRRNRWPMIFFWAFVANAAGNFFSGNSVFLSLGFAAANMFESFFILSLLERYSGLPLSMGRVRDVLGLALAAVFGTMVAAILATVVLSAGSATPHFNVWLVWWIADTIGILVVAPFVLTVSSILGTWRVTGRRCIEALVLYGILAWLTWGVFNGGPLFNIIAFPRYLLMPFLMWAALRFGPQGASIAVLMLAVSSVTALLHGTVMNVNTVKGDILELQIFLGISGCISLLLSAAFAERRQSELQLRQSEEKYRALFNNAETGMFRSRLDGSELLEVNNKYLSMLGYRREEIIGKPSVIVWADPKEREDMVRMLKARGNVDDFEFRLRTCSGEVKYCLTSLKVYPETGIVEGSITDITERKKAEEILRRSKEDAVEANRVKSEFLTNIAHDFRTPMNAILGFSSFLQSEHLTERQKQYAGIIHEKTNSLLGLVEDLLDVSRLESGKLELRMVEFDLAECVRKMVDMARVELGEKDVDIACVLKDDMPLLKGDVTRVNQILSNLVSNAVKYTDKGSITVRVDLLQCVDGKCRIRLSVKDTGLGIPPDKLEHIYDAFARFHEFAGGRARGGVGLGLYITKTLVGLMRGSISAVSEVGVGSEFVVEIEFEAA